MLVPVLLDKLEELEVVLHFALDQRLYPDGFVDLVFGERVYMVSAAGDTGANSGSWAWGWVREHTLQYLEILQVCILGVGVELDSRHGYIIWRVSVSVCLSVCLPACLASTTVVTYRKCCQTPGTALHYVCVSTSLARPQGRLR
jgi:hypothetical protein